MEVFDASNNSKIISLWYSVSGPKFCFSSILKSEKSPKAWVTPAAYQRARVSRNLRMVYGYVVLFCGDVDGNMGTFRGTI